MASGRNLRGAILATYVRDRGGVSPVLLASVLLYWQAVSIRPGVPRSKQRPKEHSVVGGQHRHHHLHSDTHRDVHSPRHKVSSTAMSAGFSPDSTMPPIW